MSRRRNTGNVLFTTVDKPNPTGYIEAPDNGAIEVWGEFSSGAGGSIEDGELDLMVNNEPVKRFNKKNSRITKFPQGIPSSNQYHEIHAKVHVKGGDKIYFKEMKRWVPPLDNIVIYFKPDNDKHLPHYYEMGANDTFIISDATKNFSLYLPKDPQPGRIIRIICKLSSFKLFDPEGYNIYTNSYKDFINLSLGESKTLVHERIWHQVS